MKRTAREVATFMRKPDPAMRLFLLYGTDSGAIRENARILASYFLDGSDDPLLRVQLDDSHLQHNPACLYDEAAAIPMFGGRKVIEVRLAGDSHIDVIDNYLQNAIAESVIIIETANLKPTSKLRKLVENAANAVTLPCYADDAGDIRHFAQNFLKQEGYRIEMAALDFLTQITGADRGVTMRELEKLVLYMGGGQADRDVPAAKNDAMADAQTAADKKPIMITRDDVEQIIGDSSALTMDRLIDAIALGQIEKADGLFGRLLSSGLPAQAILIRLRGHFQALHQAGGYIQAGQTIESAVQKCFRPPLHFKRKPAVQTQLKKWPRRKIEAALSLIHENEKASRQTGAPDEAIIGRVLLRLASQAQQASGKR